MVTSILGQTDGQARRLILVEVGGGGGALWQQQVLIFNCRVSRLGSLWFDESLLRLDCTFTGRIGCMI